MIQYKNGQFVYNQRAQVHLPNGLCFDFFPECVYENAFQMFAPDESFRVTLGFHDVEKDAKTFLEELFETYDSPTVLEPVYEVANRKGVLGYGTSIALTSEIIEEFAVDLPGEPQALFFARLWRAKDKPYDTELYDQVKLELLQQFRFLNPEWNKNQVASSQLLSLPYPKNLILTLENESAKEFVEGAEESQELQDGILAEILPNRT